jgi:hypothetical protein
VWPLFRMSWGVVPFILLAYSATLAIEVSTAHWRAKPIRRQPFAGRGHSQQATRSGRKQHSDIAQPRDWAKQQLKTVKIRNRSVEKGTRKMSSSANHSQRHRTLAPTGRPSQPGRKIAPPVSSSACLPTRSQQHTAVQSSALGAQERTNRY